MKLLIVDDHAVLRQALRLLLQADPDIEIVGEASDGRQALQIAEKQKPDVVLMDVAMPGLNGLEATRQIRQRVPHARVLMLSGYPDDEYVRTAVRMGADGYVVKRSDVQELRKAIRTVASGKPYFSPSIEERFSPNELAEARTKPSKDDPLSSREHEVLQLIAEGYSNQGIADALFISLKTVESHRARIMTKLRANSRADIIRYAIRRGIVRADGPP